MAALHDAPWLVARRSPRAAPPLITACLALSAPSIGTVRRGGTEHVDLATSPYRCLDRLQHQRLRLRRPARPARRSPEISMRRRDLGDRAAALRKVG